MSIDKVNGKQVLINEINRLNGIEIGENAIDFIFENTKDEQTGTVEADKLKEYICTIYALDENDEELLSYIQAIADADGQDGISIDDLNGEFDYNNESQTQSEAQVVTQNETQAATQNETQAVTQSETQAATQNQAQVQTQKETKEETMYETGSQSIARFFSYQGIDVSAQDIENAFNACPGDKDFATYLKETYQGDYDTEQLNSILKQISQYNDSTTTLALEDLSATKIVDGEEISGAQNIANNVNQRAATRDAKTVSADEVIAYYNEYAQQGDFSNEGFAKFILNKCGLKGAHQNFIQEGIDEAASFYSALELNDLQASGSMKISYEVEVETPVSTNQTVEQNEAAGKENTQETTTQTVTTTTQNPTVASNQATVTLENNTVTTVNLDNGRVVNIVDDSQNEGANIKATVDTNGTLISKAIETPEGDKVYVYYNQGNANEIYLNSVAQDGKIWAAADNQSETTATTTTTTTTTTQENVSETSSQAQEVNSSNGTQNSSEKTYEPMNPPQAAHTVIGTGSSQEALGAQIGIDATGNAVSVTLPNCNNIVFDLTDNLIEGAQETKKGNSTTYSVEDKGVEVKDVYTDGNVVSRQITAPDGTTNLYICYNNEGAIESLWLNSLQIADGGNIYNSTSASSSQTSTSSTNSAVTNEEVDNIIANVTTLGNAFDGEVEETTDENGNRISIQQYELGSIETKYDQDGNEISKTVKDQNGNITSLIEYNNGAKQVTQYLGGENYTLTKQDSDGNVTVETKDNNATINIDKDGITSITLDGKTYTDIVKESDTRYSYSANGKTYYFEKGADGNWVATNTEGNETTPETRAKDSVFNKLSTEEQTSAVEIEQAILADGVSKGEIKDLFGESADPLVKMAALELLAYQDGYADVIKKAMKSTDKFLEDGISQMLNNKEKYSIQDIIDFENSYVELNQTDDLWDSVSLTEKDILDLYLSVYARTSNEKYGGGQEALENANENLYFSVSELAVRIQDTYSKDNETERLTQLIEYAGFSKNNIENVSVPSNAAKLEETYLQGDNKENLLAILEGLEDAQNGKNGLDFEEGLYLLSQEFNSPANLIAAFRDLKDGEQEQYIQVLFDTVTYKTSDNKTSLQQATSSSTSDLQLQTYIGDNAPTYNKNNVATQVQTAQRDKDLTPEDRLTALEAMSESYGCHALVQEQFTAVYNASKIVHANDISTIAKRQGDNIEAIESYIERCLELSGEDSIAFMQMHMLNYGVAGIKEPSYINAVTDVFRHQKDYITSENIEKLEQSLAIDEFVTNLAKGKTNLTLDDEEYLQNVFDAIGQAEINAQTYVKPDEDTIAKYIKTDNTAANRTYILTALANNEIDVETAKELLIYVYCDNAKTSIAAVAANIAAQALVEATKEAKGA